MAARSARITKERALACLKGSVMFMSELAKRITVPVTMDFMSCSAIRSGTVSKGIVKIAKDLDEPIEGRDALIVEDIIDSGNTLSYLIEILASASRRAVVVRCWMAYHRSS